MLEHNERQERIDRDTNSTLFVNVLYPKVENISHGGGEGGGSLITCRSGLTIDHASHSRRRGGDAIFL